MTTQTAHPVQFGTETISPGVYAVYVLSDHTWQYRGIVTRFSCHNWKLESGGRITRGRTLTRTVDKAMEAQV